jgi:hypothetical protein
MKRGSRLYVDLGTRKGRLPQNRMWLGVTVCGDSVGRWYLGWQIRGLSWYANHELEENTGMCERYLWSGRGLLELSWGFPLGESVTPKLMRRRWMTKANWMARRAQIDFGTLFLEDYAIELAFHSWESSTMLEPCSIRLKYPQKFIVPFIVIFYTTSRTWRQEFGIQVVETLSQHSL